MKSLELYNGLKKSITKENMELIFLMSKDYNETFKELQLIYKKYNEYTPSRFYRFFFHFTDYKKRYLERLNKSFSKKLNKKYKTTNINLDYIIGDYPLTNKEPIITISNNEFEITMGLKNDSISYISEPLLADDSNFLYNFFTFIKTDNSKNNQIRTFISPASILIEKKDYKELQNSFRFFAYRMGAETKNTFVDIMEYIDNNNYCFKDFEHIKSSFELLFDINNLNDGTKEIIFCKHFLILRDSIEKNKYNNIL